MSVYKEEVKKILLKYYQADYYPAIRDDVAEEICQLFKLKLPENPYPEWLFPLEPDVASQWVKKYIPEVDSIFGAWGRYVFTLALEQVKELNKEMVE